MLVCGASPAAARAFLRDLERVDRVVEARLAEAQAQIAYTESEERAETRILAALRTKVQP
jgi:hypothetical protein